ncbi:ATP-binding protein [Rhizobium leguminosarum]|uniref:AAA family ATPase n=1 Tax=Rhizobium leguminosarum TaxID=384 RepID=UPI001C9799A4|nr:AAA family ATPase [Rhizobium leguminosarum]MBY5482246.1 ATP-binding protein [Rhizobium leguminosarum]
MITLSPQRLRQLVDALTGSFEPTFLEHLLMSGLGLNVHEIVSPHLPYKNRIREILLYTAGRGRLEELLRVAYEANPRSKALRSLNEAVGLLPPTEGLVDLVRPLVGPERLDTWTSGLDEVRQQICSVVGGQNLGTGFLVGPAQIMTHLAVTPLGADGRFDPHPVVSFIGQPGSTVPPKKYSALQEPVFVSRSGLVVLQLDREAGREIEADRGSTTSRGRGWIVPRGSAEGMALIVVQFPQDEDSGGDLRIAIDPNGLVSNEGGKLRYSTATQPGATGAPCFDINWDLIGVHADNNAEFGINEGISIASLIEELHEKHFRWDLSSGITQNAKFVSPSPQAGELDERIARFEFSASTADDVWNDDPDDDPSDPDRWAWAEAAAVTSTYDPERLVPTGVDATGKGRARIVIESIPVNMTDGLNEWMLSENIRLRALERLSTPEALRRARANNPGSPSDPVNVALGALIDGHPIKLSDRRDPARLRPILQAAGWLARTDLQLPSLTELHADLERTKLLAPFRHLTRGFFAGRDLELARLGAYVECPDGSIPRALFLHGPGGMGKSALIAHFIIAHSNRDAARFDIGRPFIYLDFDRPELDARDHLGILLAIARQIPPQFPPARKQVKELLDTWSKRRLSQRGKRSRRTRQPVLPAQTEAALLMEVAAILSTVHASAGDSIPIIFDTLEEVQYATPDAVLPLVELIARLHELAPPLRPILAGRVEIESSQLDGFHLEPLPWAAAEALLSNHLPPLLAAKSDLIERMIRVVGGNPLSLRLAADMLRRETEEGRQEIGEEDLWQHIGDAVVQGHLYERIVGHLHDSAVKRIAIPGLVLRYITPELIQRVLAGPCGVAVPNAKVAGELFDSLARETALVRQGQDLDRLAVRSDLRRTVLGGFRKDRSSTPTRLQIHTAAVSYFSEMAGPENRAEEIYHRLWLDEDPHQIDSRWLTGVESSLRNAVEELEGRARLYLANRVGVIADTDMSGATQEEWERYAEKRARDLLQLGLARPALAVLHGRSERQPASRLHLLESIAHSYLGENAQAEAFASSAVAAARVGKSSDDIETTLEQLVQARRQLGDTEGVLRALAELGNLGEMVGDDLIQVEANTAALESVAVSDIDSQTFSDTAVRVFSRLPDELVVRAPELARRLAAQVGGEYPALLQRVVRLVGIGPLDASSAADLGSVLQGWADRDPDIAPYLPRAPASVADVANATQYLVGKREMDPDVARSLSIWMQPIVSANASGATTTLAHQDSLPVSISRGDG